MDDAALSDTKNSNFMEIRNENLLMRVEETLSEVHSVPCVQETFPLGAWKNRCMVSV